MTGHKALSLEYLEIPSIRVICGFMLRQKVHLILSRGAILEHMSVRLFKTPMRASYQGGGLGYGAGNHEPP